MSIICIRGAICAENTKEDILEKTKDLLSCVFFENKLKIEDIYSVIFTATKDLDAEYPAVAAREMGITEAALMCMQEMYKKGSIKGCIRVMVTARDKGEKARHVYLGKAAALRPDIKL